MRPYDFRHACATTWFGAGVGLGECARRMGHSVEVLVSVYAGALEGDDLEANRRIDDACRESSSWLRSSARDVAL
jgi:integrase